LFRGLRLRQPPPRHVSPPFDFLWNFRVFEVAGSVARSGSLKSGSDFGARATKRPVFRLTAIEVDKKSLKHCRNADGEGVYLAVGKGGARC
jgi:hypothetical protein